MSDDNTRRHWHGTSGDRYEHHNVWMNGGAKSPTTRAPWAMPLGMENTTRRDSTTSDSSTSNKNAENASPAFQTLSERRRSSSGGSNSGLFANLRSQKRESTDPNMTARRASWNEQASKGGMFSKWWEGYTRGSASSGSSGSK